MNERKSAAHWMAVLVLVLTGHYAGGVVASGGIQFTNLSVEDGLSQTSVQAVLQDRRGFIWLGTQEGLNRFDGLEFAPFFHEPGDDRTLAHDWIWTLHEDRLGHLWVGTGGGGLDRLNPVTGRVDHFRHVPGDAGTIGANVVRDIAEDERGYLWIGTDGGGLARLDPADDTVTRLGDLPAGHALSQDHVRVLHRDSRGALWVGTDGGGVDRVDPVDGSVEHVAFPGEHSASRIRAIASRGGMLWLGTYESGLLRLEVESGEVTRFTHDAGDPDSLSGNSVRALFVDDIGTLWIGTDGDGLNRFISEAEGFRHYRHDATDPSSLADDHVVELAQDRGGVIWVGTYRGTSRWNPSVGTFTTVARHGDAPDQLSDNYVTSLAETGDGAIWAGTYGGGLNRWNRDRDTFEHFTHDAGDPSTLSDDRVFALAPDGDALWIGLRGGGLNRMDLSSYRVRRYEHEPARGDSLSADGVTSILRDSRGTIWVGTFVGGLNRLDDAEDGRFTRFRHDPGDEASLCSDRVLALIEGFDGDIWIGTYGGGICRLDASAGTFTTFRHEPEDPTSLSSDRAWSLHEDAAGNLWIGTQDGGLNLWRARDRRDGRVRFQRFGREHGLGSLGVYAAESDSQGRVWLSTNRGLARLDPATEVVRRYDVTRGLQSNEFNHGAHGRTRVGELMFGGIAGFNIFRPESIRINDHPPQIAFTEITRLNQPMDVGPSLEAGRPLEFTYRDVLVSFKYAALDYTAPSRNRYQHRLVGFDPGWVDDGAVRRTTYTNLASGSYRFEVRAANSDGIWSEAPLALDFTVLPAPWATLWARTAYALSGLVLLLLLYRGYAGRVAVARQIQETNEALRTEMDRREQQQRALVTAKEQAQRYLDVVEVIILSLDVRGGIRLVNQKGLRTLGYSEQELIGRNFYDVLVPPPVREVVRRQFDSADGHAYSESPILTRDGAERLIAWHTTALPATEDHPEGLLVSGMDLTDQRSLEQQVREAQKLEALGTLSRGIAHDFNNILSAIQGFAELVRKEVAKRSTAAGYLDDLELSVDRARNLIRSILTFGRQTKQEVVPTLLQSQVQEAMHLLRPALPPRIEVVSRCEETAPPVAADPTRLHQLVMNLATNAIQSMDEQGGTLTLAVSVRELSQEQARAYSDLQPGRYVELVVEDTGPGMDENTRTRMFEPFFTTKGPNRGTGLGLSVVHGIVTQMGGDIGVDSRLGRGTRISILLPACAEGLEQAPTETADTEAVSGGSGTVMLVDDEPVLLELERAMLGPLGYQVICASGGAQALRKLEQGSGVDVVVTDQNMPGMTGLDLARAIRAEYPKVPVILVSGAYDAGVDDSVVDSVLEKPFKSRDLARAVRNALNGIGAPGSHTR